MMTHIARKSITNLFLGGHSDAEIIGHEISHPTQSQPTRKWAQESESKSNNELTTDLKHSQMQLLAERAQVQELQKQLKSLMDEKYSNQSSIVDQLRLSQDKLREQLTMVIASKMDLCESTALELERLRIIISELSAHINKNDPSFDIDAIMNKYKQQSQAQNNFSHSSLSMQVQMQMNKNKELQQQSLEEQLNNATKLSENNEQKFDSSLPQSLQPFPHRDPSRIDIRTIVNGDQQTYPDPFAAVDLKYTGYKYLVDSNRWTKFTSTNISSTVFETRLGNHENIIGLEQAVLSMTRGEVARVWVPSRLGYGVHGAEPLIPPNTDLVFELTLVEIRNNDAFMQQQANAQQEHEDIEDELHQNDITLNGAYDEDEDEDVGDEDVDANQDGSFQVL